MTPENELRVVCLVIGLFIFSFLFFISSVVLSVI